MSSVAATIQELFESGQSSSKICDLLKGWCLHGSQAFKKDRLGPPKGEEHSKSQGCYSISSSETPERRSEEIQEEVCKNWSRLLV